jgi:hypothetical protein
MAKIRLSQSGKLKAYISVYGDSDVQIDLSLDSAYALGDSDFRSFILADSPTSDDSDSTRNVDCSNTILTMDNAEFKWWSADSDEFQAQIATRSV